MATDNVTTAAAGPEFFQLSATYLIDPAAKDEELLDDFDCVFGAGIAVFEERFEQLTQQEWAGLYMLRQAKAIHAEIRDRVRRREHGALSAGEA